MSTLISGLDGAELKSMFKFEDPPREKIHRAKTEGGFDRAGGGKALFKTLWKPLHLLVLLASASSLTGARAEAVAQEPSARSRALQSTPCESGAAGCCAPGMEWHNGTAGSPCTRCEAGRFDADSDPTTPCEECTADTPASSLESSRCAFIAPPQDMANRVFNPHISTLLQRTDASVGATAGDWNGDGLTDVFVANYGRANEHLWYDWCSDGYARRRGDVGCYVCPRYTTDTRASMFGCELCAAGLIGPGAGLAHDQRFFCVPCESGKTRSLTETECSNCPAGKYSPGSGLCEDCLGIVDAARRSCTACPRGQQPDHSGTKCVCSDGNFNASTGIQCYSMDYSPPASSLLDCLSCDDLECVDGCADQSIDARPGWLRLLRDDGTKSIFQCKQELACNGTRCNEGYHGPLCGACQTGYNLDSEGLCNKCEETTWLGVAILAAALLVVAIALCQIERWYGYFATLSTIVELAASLELKAMAKVLVTTMQIVSNFAKVLNIPFPADFRDLLRLLAIFRFDFAFSLGIGCFYSNSYLTSLATSLVTLVVIMIAVGADYLYLKYRATDEAQLRKLFRQFDRDGDGVTGDDIAAMVQKVNATVSKERVKALFADADTDSSGRVDFEEFHAAFDEGLGLGELVRKARQTKALNDSLGRFFLLVFLLYPGLTNKIFEIFLCRDLGPNTSPTSVLHADYNVDCEATQALRWAVGSALVLAWPIGLPALLFYLMFRARARIVAGDEDTVGMFNFLIADYKTDFWYWEVVELGRKLILSGLISLLGRGSIAQAVVATMVSFFFFAANVRALPYKSRALNIIKIVSEVQLFVVLLVCVILQQHHVGFDGEVITLEDYGLIQTVATLFIVPVAIFLIVYNARGLKNDLKSDINAEEPSAVENEVGNPMAGSEDD